MRTSGQDWGYRAVTEALALHQKCSLCSEKYRNWSSHPPTGSHLNFIFGMDRYAKGSPECAVVTETHHKAVKF